MPSEGGGRKPRSLVPQPVAVIADWDADGATSAAMIYYAQYYRKVYPLKGRHEVVLEPAGPRGFPDALGHIMERGRCPEALAVLDIPLTPKVYEALAEYTRSCPGSRVIYIDHHFSTLYNSKMLYEITEEVFLGHKPAAVLTFQLLRSLGVRHLTPRLTAFMKAVGVLERSGRPTSEAETRVVRLAASISKASTVLRDKELWRKLVRWLASPLPQDAPIDLTTVERVVKVAEKSDQEIMDKARDLAFSAKRLGYIKFVDARRKWKGRGASALASKLYKILRQPVAVLVRRNDGSMLLIIRSRGRGAYRVAVGLLKEGIAENIGGHSGLAVIKLRDGVDVAELEKILRRLSLRL
jgi:oligoribonuclease NrnB/cAMP/cGMP phosphodiesterase (DHH superfamily)